jgi:FkbM family methyltransferase
MALRSIAKAMRSSQPFNRIVTSLVRGGLSILGIRSEWIIKHVHRVGDVADPLPNGRTFRLWSNGDDWVSNQVYWRGWEGYEPESAAIFFKLASRARATLDVGAYVGYYTLLAAHANPTGRVIAFEPHPGIYERLRSNVLLNELSNVECVNAAAGDRAGRAEFFVAASGLPTSSSLSQDFMKAHAEVRSFGVPVVTLDTLVREHDLTNVDLIKIDTESTEAEVLRGAAALLARDQPAIVCEVLAGRAREDELDAVLRPLGYRYYLLTPNGPASRASIEGDPRWLNYLFVPESRVEMLKT